MKACPKSSWNFSETVIKIRFYRDVKQVVLLT